MPFSDIIQQDYFCYTLNFKLALLHLEDFQKGNKAIMPHCCAAGCSNEAKNKNDPSISFHRVPLESVASKKWLAAIGRPLSNLPKELHLCSVHFEPQCFDECGPAN